MVRNNRILSARGRLIEYHRYFSSHPFEKFVLTFLDSFHRNFSSQQIVTKMTFAELLCLKPKVLAGIIHAGYKYVSSVQTNLPILCADPPQSMTIQAASGCGKTVAMAILALNRVDLSKNFPQVVCVLATSELVIQFTDKIQSLAAYLPELNLRQIIQGQELIIGSRLIEQILVGTPKEMVSLRILGLFDADKVALGIFDDADVVVTSDIVQRHLVQPLKHAQVILTSATISKNYGVNGVEVFLPKEEEMLDNLSNFFVKCEDRHHKFDAIEKIVNAMFRKFDTSITKIIIFCNKRESVDWLKYMFYISGYNAKAVTGEMAMHSRVLALHDFAMGDPNILVTTNMFARGLDVPNTKLVINFDLPLSEVGDCDTKSYLHRIGRAGRFGQKAAAVTLFLQEETQAVEKLAAFFDREISLNY